MPIFQIQIVNSDFVSSNEIEASNLKEAKEQALRGALGIGADELCRGTPFFGAEVSIRSDGDGAERFVLGMGQSPLK